jgi:hypothetical protein
MLNINFDRLIRLKHKVPIHGLFSVNTFHIRIPGWEDFEDVR